LIDKVGLRYFSSQQGCIPGEGSQVVLRTGECPAEDVVHRVLGHNDPEAAHMEAQAVRLAVQVKIQLPAHRISVGILENENCNTYMVADLRMMVAKSLFYLM
jgi:hypothetical protein